MPSFVVTTVREPGSPLTGTFVRWQAWLSTTDRKSDWKGVRHHFLTKYEQLL
jgi:hypothetical protein